MKVLFSYSRTILILFFGLVSFLHLNAADVCCESHSFFRSRPIVTDFTIDQGLTLYEWYHRKTIYDEKPWFLLNVAGFYYTSTHKKQLAEYFLPKCKCAITVAQNNTSDVSSLWINIGNNPLTPFSSNVSLHPHRSIFGATFDLRMDLGQYFSAYYNNESLEGFWTQIFFPILQAKHVMDLEETDIVNPGEVIPGQSFANVTNAFQNPAWCFGKISPCALSMKGFGDVKLSLGYDWYETAYSSAAIYGSVYIPTSHGSHATHLFEPTIGNGGHVGVALGLLGDLSIWTSDECHNISLLFDIEGSYFTSHREWRSFDLKPNGDWSRYLLLANQAIPNVAVQGINLFTRDVEVTPRGMVDIWAALHWQYSCFNFELGYNFWWHQREKVSLNTCNDTLDQYGIFDISVFCNGGENFTTDSTATISVGAPNHRNGPISDPTFVNIKVCDLNASTAECPSVTTNKIYAAAAGDLKFNEETLGMIGIGGSYEFSHDKRNALSQWGIWVKVGVSF